MKNDLSSFDTKNHKGGTAVADVLDYFVEKGEKLEFKEGYTGYEQDKEFWQSVQSLHDIKENWDLENGGLTDRGKNSVKNILSLHAPHTAYVFENGTMIII